MKKLDKMSVVTETRKTKQKWSLNPRGKAWSEDSNKFGQKMLEKMGWSRGKGLGAKENGVIEHIRLSYKNDTKGMGYKESDGQWTEHDVHYNAVLQSLSGQETTENEIKIASLEKKSQSSKVRVHYKKFTRGKDLSRYSEQDLAQIFGKKSLKVVLPNEGESKEPDTSFAHNAGSMVDYFKKKLPILGKIVTSPGMESEEENSVGFGFKTPEKKRKLSEASVEGTPKKIKTEEDQIGLSNPAFDPFFNGIGVQKHILNTIEEETEENNFEDSDKKKKGNREESFEEEVKNKKKKKKIKENFTAIQNTTLDDLENGFEVKRKKKKSKNNTDNNDSQCSDNFEVKRKKKNQEENSLALDNPNFTDEGAENGFVDENFEVKRKKKKKREMAIDNPNFNDENGDESTFSSDFEVKRKKKKNKSNDTLAIDNPNFNDFDNEDEKKKESEEVVQNEPQFDLMLNVTSTPCVQEEKSSKKVKRRKSVRFSEINEERIIPNEEIQLRNELFDINTKVISNGLKECDGTPNLGFDKSQVIINENIDDLSRRIDGVQAEIENDMNEAKCKNLFGEKLANATKLKFVNVKFGRTPPWARKNTIPTAKKSYKHLIRGDIILEFNNTNLHEITGYGVNVKE